MGTGLAGVVSPGVAAYGGNLVHEVAGVSSDADVKPERSIKFAVIGLDHNHIFGLTSTIQRGGGELVSVYSADGSQIAGFQKRFGPVKVAASEEEILNDASIELVAAAPIPDQRAALGIRVMEHNKDYLVDKPGMIKLEELEKVRKAIQETKRRFAIFLERMEVRASVKASELVKAGAIGRVVQTVNLAPHQINPRSRPDWFWDPTRYGGILCDLGSHQADTFLYFTGSVTADVTASQIANVSHPDRPEFQDFGEMMLYGNGGSGYARVDWFTPDGLGTWGDGRLFILGTEGYIELRKYIDIAGRKGENHLFLVSRQQPPRYIDCSNVALPFGGQFVADIVNRTHGSQDQTQVLLATELVLKAQKEAQRRDFAASVRYL